MNREQLVKEFAELNGIHWHDFPEPQYRKSVIGKNRLCISKKDRNCKCGANYYDPHIKRNPTFSHPEEVLRLMMGRKDFDQFAQPIFKHFLIVIERGKKSVTKWAIPTCYITEHDKLFDAAHKWSVEHKEGA